MKPIVVLALLVGSLEAGLVATVNTSRGSIAVELLYETAPQAVANFITLSQGTRRWLDPRDGTVRAAPYYNGLKIHRTESSGSFRFAQGGSILGEGLDGPGYTIKDEFHPSVTHVPYVLSMANAGPNTNGAQFFFTGALPQPTFDGVHTVMGLVTDPASRAVVDAMIDAGPDATTINGISINRGDPAATAFNEHAQGLPDVVCPKGNLSIIPGDGVRWTFDSPSSTGTLFHAFRSPDLAGGWAALPSSGAHIGIGPAGSTPSFTSITFDTATLPRAFYQLGLATHPGSVAPNGVGNRAILADFNGAYFLFEFNAAGTFGLGASNWGTANEAQFVFQTLAFSSAAHHFRVTVQCPGFSPPYQILRIHAGCDTADLNQIDGRHSTSIPIGDDWLPVFEGAVAISR